MNAATLPRLDPQHPWPGLDSFDENDSAYFHGREGEAAELLRLVEREPLTVLFGRSGLGKSSLLKAGVFPALRERDLLPVYLRLGHGDGLPPLREQVYAELDRACAAAGVQPARREGDEALWSVFHRRDAEFWSARHRLVTPVLVFDQFEEIFTLGQRSEVARAQAEAFIAELADLVENRPPADVKRLLEDDPAAARRYEFRRATVKLVLSFREDFLAAFEGLKTLMPSLMYNRLRLLPMAGAQAYAVVTRAGGALVDDEVARRILRLAWKNDAATPALQAEFERIEIDPALLSVVCSELNHKRLQASPPLAAITPALLAGADREILSGFYERAMAGLDERVRRFVEDELITDRGFRDSHDWDDALALPGVTREALEVLVARRLLRVDERLGQRRLELTHDVLTRVVRDSRDSRRTREAEAAAAAREAAAQLQQRRNRRNAALVLAGVLLTAVLGAHTYWQGGVVREARRLADQKAQEAKLLLAEARSARLMASADTLQARQLDAALLVNLEALREAPTLDARAGLQRRFDSRPGLAAYLSAHAREVTAVAFSADGRQLASAGEDGTLILWDLATRAPLATLAGPKTPISVLAFSADGKRLAAGSRSLPAVTLWDVAARKLEATLEGHRSNVWALAFSADGSTLASAGTDKQLILWDVAAHQRKASLAGHERTVLALAFSPDGRRLASAGGDAAILLWDLPAGRVAARLAGHAGEVNGLAFSADGSRLASAGSDQAVMVWSLAGAAAPSALKGHKSAVARVAFAADGKRLVSAGVDQTVIQWGLSDGKPLATVDGVKGLIAPRMALSADGSQMASTNGEQSVLLWDLARRAARTALAGHAKEVYSTAFSADGKRVATGGSDALVLIWDAAQAKLLHSLRGHEGGVWGLAFTPDGAVLASAGEDGTLRLWDVAKGLALGKLEGDKGHKGRVLALALSADGKRLASAGEDHQVMLWDVASRKQIAVLAGHTAEVTAVAFSPDGTRLVSASNDRSAILWDLDKKQPGARLDAQRGALFGLAFAPDGQTLATANEEGSVTLWGLAGNSLVATLTGHADRVSSVAISADGLWLATSSADRTVALWDLGRRQLLASLGGPGGEVNAVAFSPDGRRLAAVSDRGPAAELLDLDAEVLAQAACRSANRNLSCQEWRQHVGLDIAWRKSCPALPGPAQACR
ncbi:WD_REPEATS_REGION domain-containing protein [Rubrivivax sp. A210]|uniref:nSTAND1 domain-containing NTPase n=1 Tax=Rubrivivax sp. A210 TaxID=2772301 RepID=UPI00191A1893|nr:PD40 domain-containing protein [Rubrivivax sp. A210]CAD5373818.1 WD_REPEATS_REGION domain-containing protein [Rubrivivax sp. A210]